VLAFVVLVAVYLGFAAAFRWLMQPTVMENRGLAAYQPPPNTVLTYTGTPWTPPPSEPFTSYALAEPAPATTSEPGAKKDTKSTDARTAARPERPARARRTYAPSRRQYGFNPFGFRPWF
jgi:hypothetical protein